MSYLRTVTHREMRNSSGEILRAVAAEEDLLVTNNDQPPALVTRPATSEFERLRALGATRPARKNAAFPDIRPRKAGVSTQEILDDLRRD